MFSRMFNLDYNYFRVKKILFIYVLLIIMYYLFIIVMNADLDNYVNNHFIHCTI